MTSKTCVMLQPNNLQIHPDVESQITQIQASLENLLTQFLEKAGDKVQPETQNELRVSFEKTTCILEQLKSMFPQN